MPVFDETDLLLNRSHFPPRQGLLRAGIFKLGGIGQDFHLQRVVCEIQFSCAIAQIGSDAYFHVCACVSSFG